MQDTLKRKKNGQEAEHFLEGKYQKWLADAAATPKGLDALLEDSRQLTQQLLEEREQEKRIRYFEQSVNQLLQTCFPTLTKPEEVKLQLWKGQSYETFGAWDKALAAFQCVIDLCDSEEFAAPRAKAHRFIGHIQIMQSRFADALESYQESLKLTQECGDKKGEACSYNSLAFYYFEKGKLTHATSHWEKALVLAEKINDIELQAAVNSNLGIVANVAGNWEKALAHYGESLQRLETIGDSRGLAKTYHNLAKTYADMQRWPEAGAHYEKGYQLAKEVGDTHVLADIKFNRAELYVAIGDLNSAETLSQRALKTYLQLEDHLGEADVYKLLGAINAAKNDWPAAQSYFENSIILSQTFKSPLCGAEAHFEYGRMYRQKGNRSAAQEQYELALSLFTQVAVQNQIEKVNQEIAEL